MNPYIVITTRDVRDLIGKLVVKAEAEYKKAEVAETADMAVHHIATASAINMIGYALLEMVEQLEVNKNEQ